MNVASYLSDNQSEEVLIKNKGVALEGNELKQLKTEEWTEGLL